VSSSQKELFLWFVTNIFQSIALASVSYRLQYGGSGGTYVILTGLRSASEIDAGFEHWKQFAAALGENGLRRLGELEAASVDSFEHQLFVFNPNMSYVSDEYLNADADFWAPKEEPAVKTVAEKKKRGQ
jgi:hypothetical protein